VLKEQDEKFVIFGFLAISQQIKEDVVRVQGEKKKKEATI
jgi:hypothetical protein